ncbi:MAG: glycosyltransferase family 4 protein [Terracidiphilus sp.]|jgi:glycosyltransferase involved in cell wall biosynthesis
MKIAQIAPLHESVPPQLYGGTERVISYLTEELVRQGHHVTLFASGDSITSAHLSPACDQALRLRKVHLPDPLARHMQLIESVVRRSPEFDVMHFHLDYLPFSHLRRQLTPAITTLHGRLDIPDLFPIFREFKEMNLISISNAQRKPMPWATWLASVHHGLPESLHRMGRGEGGYLAFLGRISPEKRLDRAIEIAKLVGMPLRIAAKIDPADQDYYDRCIKSLLEEPQTEFIGEIAEEEKTEFLGNARALLFPIDWPEPFGLVMIEAMACGTPVIAFRGGAVEEIIDDGVTGFIVSSIEEATEAVRNVSLIDRNLCRATFERRFSARRMCHDYLRAYKRTIEKMQLGEERNGFHELSAGGIGFGTIADQGSEL